MANDKPLLYLSEETLDSLDITTEEVIESISHLIVGQAENNVWQTPKSVIQPGGRTIHDVHLIGGGSA